MFASKVALLVACLSLPLATAAAQRESVKTSSGDSSETKVLPPSKTPGGKAFKKPKNGGPEKGGDKTAGAGTMDTTDTEDPKLKASKDGDPAKPDEKAKTAYDFDLPGANGKSVPVNSMKGKVLLIVNLARLSSYNAQLAGLEKVSQTYKDKGLVLIGVPSNDFGKAEPGTPAEVAKAYADAKVDFLVTQPATLTGVHQLPLYAYLSRDKAIRNNGLHWNYTKFIVDRKGKVIVRFGPDVAPDSLEMQATLQEVLDGTWEPVKEKKKPEGGGGDDDDDDGM